MVFLIKMLEKKNDLSNLFMNYTDQKASFDNGESYGGKNLAFGYKKRIENEKFIASVVPIVGLTDLKLTDVETETSQRLDEHLLSQFVGLNAKIEKQTTFNDENTLSLEVESTAGLQRFQNYLTNFTDGDLSVDDAIDQVLGVGFSVKHSTKINNGFVIKPYIGATYNNTLSNDVQITADGENKNAGHVMNGVLGKYAGLSLTKHTKDLSFSLNFEHGNQDELKENTLGISFSKKFQKIIKENNKLKKLAKDVLKENAVKDDLIIQLIKENQKLKTENKIFKKKLD